MIAVVARDKYVLQAKGKPPTNHETQRIKEIRKIDTVNKAILGSRTHNFFLTLRTYRPDIIALGYDQKPSLNELKKGLKKHRIKGVLIVRLRAHKPEIYKTSKLIGKHD